MINGNDLRQNLVVVFLVIINLIYRLIFMTRVVFQFEKIKVIILTKSNFITNTFNIIKTLSRWLIIRSFIVN